MPIDLHNNPSKLEKLLGRLFVARCFTCRVVANAPRCCVAS